VVIPVAEDIGNSRRQPVA